MFLYLTPVPVQVSSKVANILSIYHNLEKNKYAIKDENVSDNVILKMLKLTFVAAFVKQ
jgi:hypothetical protein